MPGASADEVIARLDRLLEPYGGLGAIPRRAADLALDARQRARAARRPSASSCPLIFLGVAAFLLNVALARALALQRPQIAALKALGYSNRELGWHYVKWALVIAVARAACWASAPGAWLGVGDDRALQPVLPLPGPALPALGRRRAGRRSLIGLGAAALGAVFAVRRAVRDPAGRGHAARAAGPLPPEPRRARRPSGGASPTRARMVLRNLERQPWRAVATVIGHRLRGRHPLRRLRLHRRDGPARRDPVLAGAAAGRDGDLRRAALRAGARRAALAARRDGGRADAHRAGAAARRPPLAPARDHRPGRQARAQPRRRPLGRGRDAAAGRARALEDAGRRARRRGRATASRSRCSRARGRCARSRSRGSSTTTWASRPTWRSARSTA